MKTLCVIIVLVGALIIAGMYFHFNNQLQSLEGKNRELTMALEESRRNTKVLEMQIQNQDQRIQTLTVELTSCNQLVNNLRADLKERDAQIESLSAQVEEFQLRSGALKDSLTYARAENAHLLVKLEHSIELAPTEVQHRDFAPREISNPHFLNSKDLASRFLLSILGLVMAPFVLAFGVGLKEKLTGGKYRKF
jgi:septal ring factor EnvC (AmiA/AmiB activator)